VIGVEITPEDLLNEISGGKEPVFYSHDKLVSACELAMEVITPKFAVAYFPIAFERGKIRVKGTTLDFEGESLARHLKGCTEVALFCASLGRSIDSEIDKARLTDLEFCYLLDTAALLLTEKLCDRIERIIKEFADQNNKQTTTRYSLGYGDAPLSLQAEFLNAVSATKTMGVLVSESGMMLPLKTVTAIIGLHEKTV